MSREQIRYLTSAERANSAILPIVSRDPERELVTVTTEALHAYSNAIAEQARLQGRVDVRVEAIKWTLVDLQEEERRYQDWCSRWGITPLAQITGGRVVYE